MITIYCNQQLALVLVDSELDRLKSSQDLESSFHRCWVIWTLHKRLDPNWGRRTLYLGSIQR